MIYISLFKTSIWKAYGISVIYRDFKYMKVKCRSRLHLCPTGDRNSLRYSAYISSVYT
jgi:hypothetical protein